MYDWEIGMFIFPGRSGLLALGIRTRNFNDLALAGWIYTPLWIVMREVVIKALGGWGWAGSMKLCWILGLMVILFSSFLICCLSSQETCGFNQIFGIQVII